MSDLSKLQPRELAELKLKLVDDYTHAGQLKIKLMRVHALYYETYKPDHKSDASLERAWELTSEGLDYLEVCQKMKNIEKKISGIKTMLSVLDMEARNQY